VIDGFERRISFQEVRLAEGAKVKMIKGLSECKFSVPNTPLTFITLTVTTRAFPIYQEISVKRRRHELILSNSLMTKRGKGDEEDESGLYTIH
jgi:hypothetical protein